MTLAIPTRAAWIQEATIQLGVSGFHFLVLRLAVKNGKARWARSWRPALDEKLRHRIASLLTQPVAQEFDPATAIEDAINEVKQKMDPLRGEVELRFDEVCPVRRTLSPKDGELFVKWVRETAVAFLGEAPSGH